MPILSNNQLLNDGTFNNKKDCSTSSQETGQGSSQKVNNSWYKLDTFFEKIIIEVLFVLFFLKNFLVDASPFNCFKFFY